MRNRTEVTVKAILKKIGLIDANCNCLVCSGGGGGVGDITNVLSFNPANNRLTSTVNGVSSFTTLSFDTGDVVTTGPITVNGTTYAGGTTAQVIFSAVAALAHVPAQITSNAAPFSFSTATQVGNIPEPPALSINQTTGTLTFTKGDGTAPSNHPIDLIPEREDFVDLDLGDTSVTLTYTPSARRHVLIFRNGVHDRNASVAGAVVTFSPIGVSPGGGATEDITVFYYR
jgi:hypothetical protein